MKTAAIAIAVFGVLVACAAQTHAWGSVGHETTAAIAASLLTSKATAAVSQILNGTGMSNVSTWADDVKHEASWEWSAPLHFINTPDRLCSYDYTRDCVLDNVQGYCVAGAIANFTKQLIQTLESYNNPALNVSSDLPVDDALKFVIHFLGDIHQPLHTGFTSDLGGNTIHVKYNGYDDNLHAVWDEWIIYDILDKNYNKDKDAWAANLTARVSPGGVWADQAQNWGKCNSGQEQCTTIMATEGIYDACLNAYQCVPSGNQPCPTQKVVNNTVLGTDYYTQAAPVVDLRIAQGGVRLAALLNNVFS